MRHALLSLLAAATALTAAAPSRAVTLVSRLAVANGTDLSGLTGAGNNRLGGFGSDLIYAGGNQFYGITDRGPGGGVLSYNPRMQGFSLGIDLTTGALTGFNLTSTTIFTRDGTPYNGLNPTLLNGSSAVLGRSFDPEGLARLPNGNLLVSDEYGPSVYEFDASGRYVRSFATPANLLPQNNGTPDYTSGTLTQGRQDNRGFEGLTIDPDGRTAYAILQDPLANEGRNTGNGANAGVADGRYSRNVRIVRFDIATGEATGQFIYQLEDRADINKRVTDTFGANNQGRSIGVSAIQSLGDGKFLVLERDNRGIGTETTVVQQTDVGSKRIYGIDLTNATDVTNVSLAGTNALPTGTRAAAKSATPFVDMVAALRAMGYPIPEKIEGMTFGPRLANGDRTLIIITDNDFSVTQNGGTTQFDVCTGPNGGTLTQVALGSGCAAGTDLIPTYIYSFRVTDAEYQALLGAVPEPASWALMIGGFGLVGGTLRRRRATLRLA